MFSCGMADEHVVMGEHFGAMPTLWFGEDAQRVLKSSNRPRVAAKHTGRFSMKLCATLLVCIPCIARLGDTRFCSFNLLHSLSLPYDVRHVQNPQPCKEVLLSAASEIDAEADVPTFAGGDIPRVHEQR